MPIYEYRCPSCGVESEKFVTISGEKLFPPTCDNCEVLLMKELRTAPHFKFKDARGQITPNSFKSGRKQDSIVPINIIDHQPDGSVRVTSSNADKLELIEE